MPVSFLLNTNMLSYVTENGYMGYLIGILAVGLSSPLWLFPFHFIAVVFDLPVYLRPYTGLKKGGELFSWIFYEWGGTVVGWCWYACMRVAAFVRDTILERLWPSLKQTFVDLWNGLHDYFDVSVFWDAFREQVVAFWVAHQPSVVQGSTALYVTVAVLIGLYQGTVVVLFVAALILACIYYWLYPAIAAVVPVAVVAGGNPDDPVDPPKKRGHKREYS